MSGSGRASVGGWAGCRRSLGHDKGQTSRSLDEAPNRRSYSVSQISFWLIGLEIVGSARTTITAPATIPLHVVKNRVGLKGMFSRTICAGGRRFSASTPCRPGTESHSSLRRVGVEPDPRRRGNEDLEGRGVRRGRLQGHRRPGRAGLDPIHCWERPGQGRIARLAIAFLGIDVGGASGGTGPQMFMADPDRIVCLSMAAWSVGVPLHNLDGP
jgi:hypothetical protein